MLIVILIMTAGIVFGYLIQSRERLVMLFNKSTLGVIFLLLFFMGVSVGGNNEVMSNLDTIGLRGLQLAVATILGSVILAWVVYKIVLKNSK